MPICKPQSQPITSQPGMQASYRLHFPGNSEQELGDGVLHVFSCVCVIMNTTHTCSHVVWKLLEVGEMESHLLLRLWSRRVSFLTKDIIGAQ